MEKEDLSLFSRIKKGAYFIIGTIAMVLGIIGAFLPVLPSTPLILLAAWCYIRSSEKFYTWLISNERFGKTIEDYHEGRGIKKSTKIRAIVMMWVAILASVYFFVNSLHLRGFLIITAICVSFYINSQPTLVDDGE